MAAFADCNREKTHWSSYEAQVLLTLWADSSIQQALESTVRNEGVYSRITSELAAVGIHRSIKQCREKIKKLKQQYKKLKDQNRKIDAEWYVTMDSVLGHRPGASFECDVTYYSPDTAVENGIALADEAQLGSDGALFGASPSVENGHRKTEHHATKRWNNQRRRILLKTKQTALRRLAFQGRSCPSVAAATRGERNARREPYSLPPSEDKFSSGIHNQPTETEFYEENTGEKQHIIKTETKESFEGQRSTEDSALTGDEPIVEVQILGEEQPPIIQAMPDERFPSHVPAVSMPKQAVKRKRALCSSEEWKKMIAESDEQYVGALHRMMESESQHRREELRMRREEMELKRADAQLMKDEASSSSAVQGQLVGVLGQIAELFRAKQAALHARAPPGGHAPSPSPAASQTAPRGGQAGSELHTPAGSDAQPGADRCQTAAAESHEENRSRRTQNAIKTEVEEPVAVQLGTDTGPINLETVPARYEEGPARGATQGASAIAVQQDLLAAQREQCRLMAEHNAIQRTLVRAVSRGNRCVSELAKSIRAQTAVAAGVQDRIVQLLERQEWTNQLLAMKVMGVSSTAPQNPQETQAGLSLPSAGPSSVFPSLFPEQEAAELSLTSSATHLSNAL